ncbi:hypothetical protein J4E93_003347 [Alternaria ventricosa]|uniref:uncharacterized protein n=1 Tax=Alternaria ventricosa TaxID=1187951 RepID=UPI0020C32872|nr:uncharacterized protein J4E93_003347 [Alternaria ventricosa]KAI4650989.1 hypothetical protein J4E93_003347 [Alternaria ventricosa]
MHFQKLAIVFALSAIGLAQDVDRDDVPQQCRQVCDSVTRLTRDCDNSTNDDMAERQCICNGQNANTAVPLCAACIMQNGGEMDNDVNDIVRECSFSTTSYNPSAASTAPPASASATGASGSGGPGNGNGPSGTGAAGSGNGDGPGNAAPANMASAALGLSGLLAAVGLVL